MKNLFGLFMVVLFVGCSGVKRSENNLNKGNYEEAIELSIKKIKSGKLNKANKKHIVILKKAFTRAKAEDEARIERLKKENKPEFSKNIYETYLNLERRQSLIRPLLPLPGASFDLEDYTVQTEISKNNYADYLWKEGNRYLAQGTVSEARNAYHSFWRLKELNTNLSQIDSLLKLAHFQGTDFVYVAIENRTEQVIPRRLETAILDFDTYKLDDFWTEYHSTKQNGLSYNFGVILEIRQILISPDRVYEKEFHREKRVRDGWEYVLDDNGNVAKDSLGNDIKRPKYANLKAKVLVTTQDKSVTLNGNVLFRNLREGRNFSQVPISSQFVFENIFAQFEGDEEALSREDERLLRRYFAEFPSNEQMIYDTSTDLKQQFATILKRKKFR